MYSIHNCKYYLKKKNFWEKKTRSKKDKKKVIRKVIANNYQVQYLKLYYDCIFKTAWLMEMIS